MKKPDQINVGITSVLRRYLVGAVAVALVAACEPVLTSNAPFRDPAATIGATTRFDPLRFSGDWNVVARFVQADESPVRKVVSVSYDQGTSRVAIVDADGVQAFQYKGTAVLRPEKGEPLVVMWVDEGFRTAVLGTPSGAIGFVLDRNPIPSPDRYKAATEILKFYGWDISRLQRTK